MVDNLFIIYLVQIKLCSVVTMIIDGEILA